MQRLVWKPPPPPQLDRLTPSEAAAVSRLVNVAHEAGYELSPTDAALVWTSYSDCLCAGWLSMYGTSDEHLLEVILKYTQGASSKTFPHR